MNTITELKSFVNLPKGWHYGSGIPVAQDTINIALELNEKAENYGLITEVFPGVEGEILLCVYGWNENCLNLTIYYSDLDYSLEINDETIRYEEFINIEDAYELIDEIANIGE